VGLTITPTFDASITNDANSVAIENTIKSAIQEYQNTYANPIDVPIYFTEMTTGLGQSQTEIYDLSYANFRQGLVNQQAISGQSDQATALANLPNQVNNPVTNNPDLFVKTADIKALGFGAALPANPGVDKNGNNPGPYDGVISINTSITFPPNSQSGNYSLKAVAQHEIDEVLGLGSALPNPPINGSVPFAEDLYRYDASGKRSFTTDSSVNAYFSIDGTDRLDQFNQSGSGDYGDWIQHSTPQVQDFEGTTGSTPSLGLELTALDVLGYDRNPSVAAAPEPASVTLFGICGACLALSTRLRRRAVA
jgi:hypothetical protein